MTGRSTSLLDIDRLETEAGSIARAFASATPFPHVALDGYLRATPGMFESWPAPQWDGWEGTLDARYAPTKRTCHRIDEIPEPMAGLVRQLNEPRFVRVIESISGVDKLIPDPHLAGGGLHLSGPGGTLNPHIDFHHYRGLDLYRRVNVIVYLNTDWTVGDGGCLTLYDRRTEEPQRVIVPAFGRIVAFRTDDQSLHGFPDPIAEGRWRRSIAVYYYTAAETEVFSGDATTYWRETERHHGLARRARFRLYQGLMNVSRVFSVLAHIANPSHGVGLIRAIIRRRSKS
jgi:hypothetical protein